MHKKRDTVVLEQCLAQEIRAWLIALQRSTQASVCMALCRWSGVGEGFPQGDHCQYVVVFLSLYFSIIKCKIIYYFFFN